MMTTLKLTALLLLFSFSAWGQIINFDSIKVNVQDENSAMYYEKLICKFKFDPTLLSGEEVNHLYYGKKFSKYTTGLFDKDFGECSDYISRGNMKKAIIHGEKYLEKDPTNTEMLAYMELAYRTLENESKDHVLYILKTKTLVDCILRSGDGKTKETAYIVNSIGEEYFIANVLGKNIGTYKRRSELQKDGAIDGFSKGKDSIFFKVYRTMEDFGF